jgi:type IX secretion system PorP/SprF family membrane protein
MMKRIITAISAALLSVSPLFAQHEVAPSLTSQVFSRINFNPAGIGNSSDLNIFSQSRMQWIGFGDGAPKSTVLNVHYFHENWKSGFGGTFTYDKIGLGNRSLTAKIAYCYNLDLSETMLLSFGLSGGVSQFSKDYSEDKMTQEASSAGIVLENESKLNPDIDLGVEFSMPYIMAGVSIVHIGQTEDVTTLRPTMSYYGYVRGTIPFKDDWQFSPSLLYAHSGKSTDVIDLGCMAFYSGFSMNDLMLWGGLNFNFNIFTNAPQTALMIGGEWKVVRLGYAYEMGFGVGNYNTHELVLGFRIPTSSGKSKYNSAAKKKKK